MFLFYYKPANGTGCIYAINTYIYIMIKHTQQLCPPTFSVILLLTPRSINMLSHSVTPIAYRSLSTLAQAILPYKIKVLKFKHIECCHVNQAKSNSTIRFNHNKVKRAPHHHVGVVDDRVDIICCLD